jgi:hypothetical protein
VEKEGWGCGLSIIRSTDEAKLAATLSSGDLNYEIKFDAW